MTVIKQLTKNSGGLVQPKTYFKTHKLIIIKLVLSFYTLKVCHQKNSIPVKKQ